MPSLPIGDLTIAVAVSSFAFDMLWTSVGSSRLACSLLQLGLTFARSTAAAHFLFGQARPPHHAEPRRPLRRRRNLFPLGVRHCVQYFYEWHCRCQQHRIVQQRQQPEHPPTQPNDEGLPRDEANVSTGNAGVCRLRGAGTQGGKFGPRRVPGRVRSRQGVLPVGEAVGAVIKWLGRARCSTALQRGSGESSRQPPTKESKIQSDGVTFLHNFHILDLCTTTELEHGELCRRWRHLL